MPRLVAVATVALAAPLLLSACSPELRAEPPHCAGLVARAVTSTQPVSGAFTCLTPNEMAVLALGSRINGDLDWADYNRRMPGKVGPMRFDRRLRDGGFVYYAPVHTLTKGDGTMDLILWVNRSGLVENIALTGRES